MDSGNVLLSRAVSSQVPSALKGLTSVFGMGTGGTPSPSSPETVNFFFPHTLTTAQLFDLNFLAFSPISLPRLCVQSSPRPISIIKLHPLPNFHRWPIYLVVLQGSYFLRMGVLFSRWASRLDAFSVYPVRISLPCYAVGTTTVAPVMRPFRSSRTRNSSSHDSYAHDG